jgi:hypothetical protein
VDQSGEQVRVSIQTKRRHRIDRLPIHMTIEIRRAKGGMRAVLVICHSPLSPATNGLRSR